MGGRSHWERILRQARICLLHGWPVIPIPSGRKAPAIKQWTKLRLKKAELEEAFKPTDNIGVLLGKASNGLVDIDLDTIEAVRAACYFLPVTGRGYGRPSKPSSHFLYAIKPAPDPVKFSDPDGTVIVELRSNGQQSLIPPSLHPSGERYQWERTGEPAAVHGSVLLKAVSQLAACALVARHWSKKGSRHDLALALAGFLLRSNWSVDEVKNFVTSAAFASLTDEEWKLRQNDVNSTLDRLVKGKPATGIPSRLLKI